MADYPIKFVVLGTPRTKKNSQQLIDVPSNGFQKMRKIPIPSAAYLQYKNDFIWQIPWYAKKEPINTPVNVKCLFFMDTRRKVDLTNLNEASHDILVDAGVLADDNRNIIASTDGSRVYYDKNNPRVEIEITPAEPEYTQWLASK